MSIGSDIGGAEETLDMVTVLAVLGILVYLYIKFPDWWSSAAASIKSDFAMGLSGLTGAVNSATTAVHNQVASASTGIDTQLNNYEANTPSEALTTIFAGPAPTIDMPVTAPGLPAGYDPATGTINLVYNGGTP